MPGQVKLTKMRLRIAIILFVTPAMLTNCSGCSESGRKAREIRNKSGNKTEIPIERFNEKDNATENQSQQIEVANSSLSKLFDKNRKFVVLIYTQDNESTYQGSGFIISKNGICVSNYHVFEGTSQGMEQIKLFDGKVYKISEVLEKSKQDDYIIFRLKNYKNFTSLKVASESPAIGSNVFAIGNPKGLEHTLSNGIISQYRAENKLIQTTTEITNGSSGGPLFNSKGEVIGITTAGKGEANLNFCINIQILKLNRFIL